MRAASMLRATAVAVLIAGGALSAAVPASAAAGDAALTIVGAQIDAQAPDGLNVTLSVTCAAGDQARLFVGAGQASETGVTLGDSFTDVVCTGDAQQVVVRVGAAVAGDSWQAGTVGVEALLASTDVAEAHTQLTLA